MGAATYGTGRRPECCWSLGRQPPCSSPRRNALVVVALLESPYGSGCVVAGFTSTSRQIDMAMSESPPSLRTGRSNTLGRYRCVGYDSSKAGWR